MTIIDMEYRTKLLYKNKNVLILLSFTPNPIEHTVIIVIFNISRKINGKYG